MLKHTLAWALATSTMVAMAAAGDGWRDVLDTPAAKSPLATRALLNGLASSGQRLIAVGQRGHILYSDDRGRNWQQAAVPSSSDLVAVTFPNAANGWAVGHDGVVLRSTDAGLTWSRQLDGRAAGAAMVDYYSREASGTLAADPKRAAALLEEAKRFAAQGAETPFLDVWFENENSGYAIGAFGVVMRTTDGGVRWEPALHALDNPKSLHLYAMRAVGNDVYIAGEQGLLLKLDRRDGLFRAVELPYKGTLFGIAGNARVVLVHGLRGTLLRSVDGGRSWQSIDTGLQVGLTASAIDADGRFIVVSQAGHVLISADEGATFKRAQVERPIPGAAIVAVSRDEVVVAGPRGVEAKALR